MVQMAPYFLPVQEGELEARVRAKGLSGSGLVRGRFRSEELKRLTSFKGRVCTFRRGEAGGRRKPKLINVNQQSK